MYRELLVILFSILLLCTCKTAYKATDVKYDQAKMGTGKLQAQPQMIGGTNSVSSPKAIIYRTEKDYTNNVPVIMDDTKTKIVSYPAPSDVHNKPVPTQLDNGYLLDNRGIGKNVAFTSWTYDEYAAFEKTPSREEILAHIIDKNPLLEMWQCNNRHTYKNLVEELNKLIADGFPGCKSIITPITKSK